MQQNPHRRLRLHPQAAYIREAGYVFIDVQGRLFRFAESDFIAFRRRCVEGLQPDDTAGLRDLTLECATADEANESFTRQEIPSP